MAQRSTVLRTITALLAGLIIVGIAASTATPVRAAVPDPKNLINNNSRSAVIDAYLNTLKPALDVPTGWVGSIENCQAGDTTPENKQAELTAINFVRALADLPPVSINSTLSKRAQASALIIEANNQLTHFPQKWFNCYTKDGYTGSSTGNIGLMIPVGYRETKAASTGARGVVLYMDEEGSHNITVGHRRWLLYSRLTQVGVGDTDHANTIVVIGGKLAKATKRWTMWPTPGFFPRELQPNGRWSISYTGADFRKATVSVTTPDGAVSTKKHPVRIGYGDNTLSWDMRLPDAYYNSTADYAVTVTVKGIRISGKTVTKTYTVTIVDADPNAGN